MLIFTLVTGMDIFKCNGSWSRGDLYKWRSIVLDLRNYSLWGWDNSISKISPLMSLKYISSWDTVFCNLSMICRMGQSLENSFLPAGAKTKTYIHLVGNYVREVLLMKQGDLKFNDINVQMLVLHTEKTSDIGKLKNAMQISFIKGVFSWELLTGDVFGSSPFTNLVHNFFFFLI